MTTEENTLSCVAKRRQIERIKEGKRFLCEEILVKEEEYHLIINELERTIFCCTPMDLKELVTGYAFTEGLIHQKEDLESLEINEEKHMIFLNIMHKQRTEKKTVSDPVSISSESVFQLWRNFDEACIHFRLTGGLHAVALCSRQDVLLIKEDVARHNALLKVLGSALLSDIPLKDKCLFFSGRVAAQMVVMIARTDVKILLCHGAATLGAVEEAQLQGLTLAGFIKNQYMNLYTGSQRIEGGME